MKKELIYEINRWEKMLEWAEKQLPKEKVSIFEMDNKIGMRISSRDSKLCPKYNIIDKLLDNADIETINNRCPLCPIVLITGKRCVFFGFYPIFLSKTWGTWVKTTKDYIGKLHQIYAEIYLIK